MAKRPSQDDKMRTVIARECARIIAEDGIKDYAKAKRKAMTRLGLSSRAMLPSNLEIEQEVVGYQRLFQSDHHALNLLQLRQTALEAMNFLSDFRPRLVGPVLHGTAGRHTDISLHVFANTPEDVIFYLLDCDIPFASSARRMRLNQDEYADFPVITLERDDVTIDLTVFWQRAERDIPWSPVDGRPMKRANAQEVQRLIDAPQ